MTYYKEKIIQYHTRRHSKHSKYKHVKHKSTKNFF